MRRVWNNSKAAGDPDTGVTITLASVGDMGYNLKGSTHPVRLKMRPRKSFRNFVMSSIISSEGI